MNEFLLDKHPKFINKVIGHDSILKNLISLYKANKLHHAYILHGIKGIGKASLAYLFSKLILSKSNLVNNTCFIDDSVFNQNINLIHKSCHPNLLVIEPEWDEKIKQYKNTITIEQTRQIKSFLSSSSLINDKLKIVIIDAIDYLNLNAANSILKILEEPASNRLFLLICHNLNYIIPTIKSRAIINNFSPLKKDQIIEIINSLKIDTIDCELTPEEIIKITNNINEGSVESYLWFLNKEHFNIYNMLQDILNTKNIANIYVFAEKIKSFSTYNLQYLLELIIKKEDISNNYEIVTKVTQLKNLLQEDKDFNLDKTAIITSYLIDLIC